MPIGRVVPLLLAALPAAAAQVTDVAAAYGEARAIQVDLDATYVHRRIETRIRRENLQGGSLVLVDELQHARTTDETDFRLAVGLYHDLELHVVAPFVIREAQDWEFATVGGVSVAATSTLTNNTLSVSGCAAPGSCTTTQPIVVVPGHSQRSGFRDPSIGVTWALVDEARESRIRTDLYPPGTPAATWVIGFDYTFPLPGQIDDPSVFGLSAAAGNSISTNERKRAHVFSGWTAFSKRFRTLDPYILLRGSAAVPVKGAYDNCANVAQLSDVAPANCASPAWQNQARYQPPWQAGLALGSELVLSEDAQQGSKIALDLRGDLTWFGAGRDYTQAADMLGKLTYAEEYVNVLGTLAVYGRPARWVQLRVSGVAGFDTPHFLTTESIGKDLNGDGSITISEGRGISAPEQNPTYDFRLDQPGRRLKAGSVFIWGISATLTLSF